MTRSLEHKATTYPDIKWPQALHNSPSKHVFNTGRHQKYLPFSAAKEFTWESHQPAKILRLTSWILLVKRSTYFWGTWTGSGPFPACTAWWARYRNSGCRRRKTVQMAFLKTVMQACSKCECYFNISHVMRLRKGHNQLNAHMFKKMKPAPSAICNCSLEDQTAEHALQRCPLLLRERTNVWPTAVQLHTKLYGRKEELEKTATFILQTGLSV